MSLLMCGQPSGGSNWMHCIAASSAPSCDAVHANPIEISSTPPSRTNNPISPQMTRCRNFDSAAGIRSRQRARPGDSTSPPACSNFRGRLGDPGDVRQLEGVQKQRNGTVEHVEHRFDADRVGKYKLWEVAVTQKTIRKR